MRIKVACRRNSLFWTDFFEKPVSGSVTISGNRHDLPFESEKLDWTRSFQAAGGFHDFWYRPFSSRATAQTRLTSQKSPRFALVSSARGSLGSVFSSFKTCRPSRTGSFHEYIEQVTRDQAGDNRNQMNYYRQE